MCYNVVPIFYIDTRNLDVTEWGYLWGVLGELGKVSNAERKTIETKINDILLDESQEISRKLKGITDIFSAADVSVKTAMSREFAKNLTKVFFSGEIIRQRGKQLGYYSTGTNSVKYIELEDKLPQGACTSPTVSNLVMARIDQRITKYCQVFNIRYTRYADDLLFSSRIFNFAEKKWFIKKIKYILSSQKLKLNYSKIKFGQKELVLNGYVISDREIRLSRNRLSDIRRIVKFSKENHHLIDQFGPEKFILEANKLPLKYRNLNVYPFGTVFQFVQYMCGYRAFLISMTNNNYTLTPFQKELQRLIRRIEAQITRLI